MKRITQRFSIVFSIYYYPTAAADAAAAVTAVLRPLLDSQR